MDTKLIEIRDRATLVPALAIQVSAADGYLMRRAGFGDEPMIYLVMLATEKCRYDPYNWDNPRMMGNAHRYIVEHWDQLSSGDVVDVEFILGESKAPKVSADVGRAVKYAAPAIGEVFTVPYPFVQDTWVEHYDGEDGPETDEVPTWKPGVRNESVDVGNEYSQVEHYMEADAIGAQILTVVGIYRPGHFPTRVFYSRQWRDPDGKLFGKSKLRITTVPAFVALTHGYRHPFELRESAKPERKQASA